MSRVPVPVDAMYGFMTVLGNAPPRGNRGEMWLRVRCVCGTEMEVSSYKLRTGHTKSCGCQKRNLIVSTMKWKGLSKPYAAEYTAWRHMNDRCHNPEHPNYPPYGGRGIRVCARWRESFETFLDDLGARPSSKHSLDRVDNDGNYEPGNCRWATRFEQDSNTSRVHLLEFNGERLTIREWSRRTGINREVLRRRVRILGWSPERALTEPVPQRGGRYATP